jgi:outer membrane translocation and assembly module TamA
MLGKGLGIGYKRNVGKGLGIGYKRNVGKGLGIGYKRNVGKGLGIGYKRKAFIIISVLQGRETHQIPLPPQAMPQ